MRRGKASLGRLNAAAAVPDHEEIGAAIEIEARILIAQHGAVAAALIADIAAKGLASPAWTD